MLATVIDDLHDEQGRIARQADHLNAKLSSAAPHRDQEQRGMEAEESATSLAEV